MNPMKDLIEDLRSLSPQQVLLRFVIMASLLGFTTVLLIAGESSMYALIVLGLLGALCVLNPHTVLPGAVLVYCLAVWWAGVPEPMVPLAAPAGVCLLLLHTACALSAAAPAQAQLPATWFGQYAVRLAWVVGATLALSLVAYAHEAWGYGGGLTAVIAALLALGLGIGVHYWVVTTKQDTPSS
ncbi:hypothetical protein MWU75_05310 [Ornithinimicrobium sp. F0845]|uniref:hypothetical protein n=1 Tax=Ornithinimicrobium sp. F0845 TaxID=2926412 RepID=UPI001FF1629D|nr:hypothetical protein [Ornithinimicrobium sp. F0845]MCK0111555.1 hypothetical protein [Ornithinimicrobium sp. F0845]